MRQILHTRLAATPPTPPSASTPEAGPSVHETVSSEKEVATRSAEGEGRVEEVRRGSKRVEPMVRTETRNSKT
jgi:hypothetical protein